MVRVFVTEQYRKFFFHLQHLLTVGSFDVVHHLDADFWWNFGLGIQSDLLRIMKKGWNCWDRLLGIYILINDFWSVNEKFVKELAFGN